MSSLRITDCCSKGNRPSHSFGETLYLPLRFFRVVAHMGIATWQQVLMFALFLLFAAGNAVLSVFYIQYIAKVIELMEGQQYGEAWANAFFCLAFAALRTGTQTILAMLEYTYAFLWRKNLTEYLLKLYFTNKNYYQLMAFHNEIDNPYVVHRCCNVNGSTRKASAFFN